MFVFGTSENSKEPGAHGELSLKTVLPQSRVHNKVPAQDK